MNETAEIVAWITHRLRPASGRSLSSLADMPLSCDPFRNTIRIVFSEVFYGGCT
jgi:hypothetical protein